MKFYGYILAGLILLMPCLSEAGDIYHYVDDQGVEQFVDRLSAVPEQYKDQLKIVLEDLPDTAQTSPKPVVRLKRSMPKKKKLQTQKKVTVFLTSWCPYCQKLEKFLRSENIGYTRVDIERSEEGRQVYKQLNANGVPVTVIGAKVIGGYSQEIILKTLAE